MNKRRRLIGTVTNAKRQRPSVWMYPALSTSLYHQVVRTSRVYKAHDELNARVGDKVSIVNALRFLPPTLIVEKSSKPKSAKRARLMKFGGDENIQQEARLTIADNTGAKELLVIQWLAAPAGTMPMLAISSSAR
jgi:ribosomal protein S17